MQEILGVRSFVLITGEIWYKPQIEFESHVGKSLFPLKKINVVLTTINNAFTHVSYYPTHDIYVAKCRLLCRNSVKPLYHAIALRDYHWLLTSKKSLSSDWNMKIARKNIVIYKTMSFTCPLSSFAIYCDYLVSAVVHLFCYANVSRCSFDKMWRSRTTEEL